MATYTLRLLASSDRNGPIVTEMSPTDVAVLAANYLADYPNFLRLLTKYVNAAVQQAEARAPEGQRMMLVLPSLRGQASRIAQALNQQYSQGKIVYQGEVVATWPEYPGQLAFVDSQDQVTLRWVKGNPWVWILVGVLIAVIGYILYSMLRGSPYKMYSATPVGNTGTGGQGTGLPSGAGFLSWVLGHWPLVLIGAGALAVAPFAVRQIARAREAENELKMAEQGYTGE
jgi:hypothetical protein